MKTKTIQHPERYEAPGVKVKVLRRKASLMALSLGGSTEGTTGGYESDSGNESYGEENGAWN